MTKVSLDNKKAIAKSIDEVDELLSDSLIPKNNRYQYALNFDYKDKQVVLQNYLNSADFKIRQSEWKKLAPVEYFDAVPEKDKHFPQDTICILIEKDKEGRPFNFVICFQDPDDSFSELSRICSCDLNKEAKESKTIKDNECFYVDHLSEIAKQIQDIKNDIQDLNTSLSIIVNKITEFNSTWKNFIPMKYQIDVQTKIGSFSIGERFETTIGMLTIGQSYFSVGDINMEYPIKEGVTELVFAPESDESVNKNELEFLTQKSIFKETSDDKINNVKINKQENTFTH